MESRIGTDCPGAPYNNHNHGNNKNVAAVKEDGASGNSNLIKHGNRLVL